MAMLILMLGRQPTQRELQNPFQYRITKAPIEGISFYGYACADSGSTTHCKPAAANQFLGRPSWQEWEL